MYPSFSPIWPLLELPLWSVFGVKCGVAFDMVPDEKVCW